MKRIQQSRKRGARLPEGARSVTRSSQWGNPYSVKRIQIGDMHAYAVERASEPTPQLWPDDERGRRSAALYAVQRFTAYAQRRLIREPAWLDPLLDAPALACYCGEDQPCHADILIDLIDQRRRRLADRAKEAAE